MDATHSEVVVRCYSGIRQHEATRPEDRAGYSKNEMWSRYCTAVAASVRLFAAYPLFAFALTPI